MALGQQIPNEKAISDPYFQETQGHEPRGSTYIRIFPSTFHLCAKGTPFRWGPGAGGRVLHPLLSLAWTFGPQMSFFPAP